MRWTEQQYADYLARSKGARTCAGKEEQQTPDTGKTHHQTGVSKVDAGRRRRFSVTVDVWFSDHRVRDLDGCLATLLDTYLKALEEFRTLNPDMAALLPQDDRRQILVEEHIYAHDCDAATPEDKAILTFHELP